MHNKLPLLELANVSISYGAIKAVREVSFSINSGEIVTLIGANGAGKTSILRSISGLQPCVAGKIKYKGQEIQSLKPHEIVARGIVQAPEGRGIFLNLTVNENLDLGAWVNKDHNRSKAILDEVFTLFPRLKERLSQNAGTLSGGEQQMLAIGRALMAEPELLLLDEPSLGLAPQLIETIFEIIVKINKEGKTVLLVEQNANQALQIADRAVVLETGSIVLEGNAKELSKSDAVKKAYLGE